IDIRAELPADIEAYKNEWWERIAYYQEWVKGADAKLSEKSNDLAKIKGLIERLLKEYGKQFPDEEPVRFAEKLTNVKNMLLSEEERLQQEQSEFQQRSKHIQGQLRDLENALKLWDQHVLLHGLEDP